MQDSPPAHLDIPATLPVLVLKSTVLFPQQVVSVQIGIRPNLRLIEDMPDPYAVIAAGTFVDAEGPYTRANLGRVAVACRVLDRIQMGRGTTQLVLQGFDRLHLTRITRTRPYFSARVRRLVETIDDSQAVRETLSRIKQLIADLVAADQRYPEELRHIVDFNLDDPARCADLIADTLQLGYAEKRQLLEEPNLEARLDLLAGLLRREVHRAGVVSEVVAKTGISIHRTERRQFLKAQLDIIRRELTELDPVEKEVTELIEAVQASSVPPALTQQLEREIRLLRDPSTERSEGAAIRTYLEWVRSVPWQQRAPSRLNLRRARRLLNERYFGLETAQKRLLEFLAVRKFGGQTLPLLAITGPPGTGKTSLAGTLAEILERPLARIPMDAIHEEAQISGRPRTAAAAQPGRIIEALIESGVRNPVILIDDIHRLDETLVPSILEVLDPVRNLRFLDHYLGVAFDLSQALLVVTANVEEEIPEALWDAVDVITLSGYTAPVKRAIARTYMWPGIVSRYGLRGQPIAITNAAIERVIRFYTREAGVRELSTRLERICRKIALDLATNSRRRPKVSTRNLETYLGRPPYTLTSGGDAPLIGAVMGLAWTDSGGDLLPVEALLMPGEGKTTLTGLLGEVLQESAQAALSYVRSHAEELGIAPDVLRQNDLHIHFPEGAIPKDGPSAGIAVATTIASLLSERPVAQDIAMTGEISLRGRLLPVGGIHEKVLAAYRAGIRHVILPQSNEGEVAELPAVVRKKLKIHLVREVMDVFRIALGTRSTRRRRH